MLDIMYVMFIVREWQEVATVMLNCSIGLDVKSHKVRLTPRI